MLDPASCPPAPHPTAAAHPPSLQGWGAGGLGPDDDCLLLPDHFAALIDHHTRLFAPLKQSCYIDQLTPVQLEDALYTNHQQSAQVIRSLARAQRAYAHSAHLSLDLTDTLSRLLAISQSLDSDLSALIGYRQLDALTPSQRQRACARDLTAHIHLLEAQRRFQQETIDGQLWRQRQAEKAAAKAAREAEREAKRQRQEEAEWARWQNASTGDEDVSPRRRKRRAARQPSQKTHPPSLPALPLDSQPPRAPISPSPTPDFTTASRIGTRDTRPPPLPSGAAREPEPPEAASSPLPASGRGEGGLGRGRVGDQPRPPEANGHEVSSPTQGASPEERTQRLLAHIARRDAQDALRQADRQAQAAAQRQVEAAWHAQQTQAATAQAARQKTWQETRAQRKAARRARHLAQRAQARAAQSAPIAPHPPLSPTLFAGSPPRGGDATRGTPPPAASSPPPRSGERAQREAGGRGWGGAGGPPAPLAAKGPGESPHPHSPRRERGKDTAAGRRDGSGGPAATRPSGRWERPRRAENAAGGVFPPPRCGERAQREAGGRGRGGGPTSPFPQNGRAVSGGEVERGRGTQSRPAAKPGRRERADPLGPRRTRPQPQPAPPADTPITPALVALVEQCSQDLLTTLEHPAHGEHRLTSPASADAGTLAPILPPAPTSHPAPGLQPDELAAQGFEARPHVVVARRRDPGAPDSSRPALLQGRTVRQDEAKPEHQVIVGNHVACLPGTLGIGHGKGNTPLDEPVVNQEPQCAGERSNGPPDALGDLVGFSSG